MRSLPRKGRPPRASAPARGRTAVLIGPPEKRYKVGWLAVAGRMPPFRPSGQEARAMRFRLAWLTVLVAVGGSGFLILSNSVGQEPPPVAPTLAAPTPTKSPAHDFNRFTVQQK